MLAAPATPFDRSAMIGRLGSEQFDLLVVGGGITGVGIALDAATRGLRTALVERHDFASGTSSKSSKLVHGGLRYLQQGEIRLVYQALHERQRLLRNAPHLVSVLPFLVPVLTKDGPVSKKIAKAFSSALWMYDVTGGVRIGRLHRRLKAEEALSHCPTLPADRVSSGFVYFDATADDARLTLTVARTAADHGAVVVNRCAVTGFTFDPQGMIDGAVVDTGDGTLTVRATSVVSATGVWADDVRQLDEGAHPDSIRPAKGIHLTVPWRLIRNDIAVIISVPGDKRSLFLVPWGERPDGTFEHCYIGTTDTEYDGDIDHPTIEADDVAYVMRALSHALTTTINADDVTAGWAGLRPLVNTGGVKTAGVKAAGSERTTDLSRRHSIRISEAGLITVTGGKLTTYREMASDAVDVVTTRLGQRRRARTKRLRLRGADGFERLPENHPRSHLAHRYGVDAAEVEALIAFDSSLAGPLVPGLPYIRAEAMYAVRREMATTLSDVLERRTRAHIRDRDACRRAAPEVAALLAAELGWTAGEQARQVAMYQASCDAEDAATSHVGARS